MAKPASFDDLPAWQREPHRLITISDRAAIDRIPGATVALGTFIDACRPYGATMSGDGTTVIVPLTEEELEQRLKQARRGWDNLESLYEKWIETEQEPAHGAGGTVRKWAKDEGLMSPEDAIASQNEADLKPVLVDDREF